MKRETNSHGDEKEISKEKTMVIPVVQEFLKVDKEVIETGKIHIRKRVIKKDSNIDIPLINESYEIERIAVKDKIFDSPPPVRYDGNIMVIPVIKEIAEVKIRYEVTEEIHVIKNKTQVSHTQPVTLMKENVTIEREPPNR